MADLLAPKERKLFFSKQVDQSSIETLSSRIIEINDDDEKLINYYEYHSLKYKPKPIEIYIDSYGGYVYQILGLIGIIERSKTPVHTICTGAAMSCGFILLISGHKRFCYKYGTPLYHMVSSGSRGTVEDMKQDLMETERLQSILEKITLEKTSIKKEKLDQIRREKIDWFMTPEEAKKLKVIDHII